MYHYEILIHCHVVILHKYYILLPGMQLTIFLKLHFVPAPDILEQACRSSLVELQVLGWSHIEELKLPVYLEKDTVYTCNASTKHMYNLLVISLGYDLF